MKLPLLLFGMLLPSAALAQDESKQNPWTISGIIKDESGKPFPKVEVALWRPYLGTVVQSENPMGGSALLVQTNKEGRFTLSGKRVLPKDALLRVAAGKDGKVIFEFVKLPDSGGEISLNLTCKPTGNLKGRVVDNQNEAAPQMTIFLYKKGDDRLVFPGRVTDLGGDFSFQRLPAGTWDIVAVDYTSGSGWISTARVEVKAKSTVELKLTSPEKGSIRVRGQVSLTVDGKEIPSDVLALLRLQPQFIVVEDESRKRPWASATCRRNGEFQLVAPPASSPKRRINVYISEKMRITAQPNPYVLKARIASREVEIGENGVADLGLWKLDLIELLVDITEYRGRKMKRGVMILGLYSKIRHIRRMRKKAEKPIPKEVDVWLGKILVAIKKRVESN